MANGKKCKPWEEARQWAGAQENTTMPRATTNKIRQEDTDHCPYKCHTCEENGQKATQ